MRAGRALALLMASGASLAARSDVVEGNPSSSVKVIIYEDLQCANCLQFRGLLDQKILPKYGSRVAFIHRDLPLAKHDWARPAAAAARWVYERNPQLGITFRREIMSEQEHISADNLNSWLVEFATRNHLDQKGIADSLSDPRLGSLVEQDYLGAAARGVTRIPTVYVGNQALVEIITYDDLARLIDVELTR